MLKRVVKAILITFSGVLLLIVILCLLLSSGYLNNFIADQAEKQTQKFLNGQLSIGKVEGNPLTHLTLFDLSLKQENREIIKIGQTQLEFSLLRLLHSELAIKKISIDKAEIEIRQNIDSIWNVVQIYLPAPPEENPKADNSNFILRINEIACSNLVATILPLDSTSFLPKKILTNFQLNLLLQGQNLQMEMKSMNVDLEKPDFSVKNITFDFNSDSIAYNWNHLHLEANGSKLISSGSFFPSQPYLSNVSLSIDTVALETFQKYIPGLKLMGHPSVEVAAKGEKERIYISAEVREADQFLRLAGWIKDANSKPTYDLHLNVQNLDGSHWTGDSTYHSKISGAIQIFGKGLDLKRDSVQASGIFPEVQYLNKVIHELSFNANKDADHLSGTIKAETWFGGLKANYQVGHLFSEFNYLIQGSSSQIDLAKLELPYRFATSLNLNFQAKGIGMNPLLGSASINVNSSSSSVFNRPIEEISTSIDWNKGNYILNKLKMNTPYFLLSATAKGNLTQLNKLQYSFESKDFNDLLRLMNIPQFSFQGNIRGTISGNKKRFEGTNQFDHLHFSYGLVNLQGVNGNLAFSKAREISALAVLNADQLNMDTLSVRSLQSNLNLRLNNELFVKFKFSSDSILHANQSLGSIQGETILQSGDSLKMEAHLNLDSLIYKPVKVGKIDLAMKLSLPANTGRIKSIAALHQLTDNYNFTPLNNYLTQLKNQTTTVSGEMELNNLSSDSLSVKKSNLELAGQLSMNQYNGKFLATLDQIRIFGQALQKAKLTTQFATNDFRNQLIVTFSDTVKAELNATVQTEKELTIGLQNSFLKSPKHTWNFGSDSTFVSYGKEQIEIRNFAFAEDKKRHLSAEGIYSFKGKEDLTIRLEEVDLQNLNKITRLPVALSGIGEATFLLNGTSGQPEVKASLSISNLKVNEQRFGDFHTKMNIASDSIQLSAQLDLDEKRLLEGTVNEFYHFTLEDQFKLPPLATPINAHMKVNQLDISMFQSFIPIDHTELKGILNANLSAEGPLGNLNLKGGLSLTDGKIHLPDYGIDYDQIQSKLNFSHDSILINNLVAQAGSGSISVNGYSSLKMNNGYEPKHLSLKIVGKEFKIVDSERVQATINTDILLKKEDEKSHFSGNVEVLRSSANADIIMADYNRVKEFSDQPLLVKALQEKGIVINPENVTDTVASHPDPALVLYKNLSGSFNIKVPGNMWIRGKDMGLEVKGNLQAMKEGEKFVLFGELEVKRGFYKMYGKRFEFISGKITLTGEDDINPVLDFDIAYPFRDLESKLKSLHLKVTGRLKEPQLNFEIDGKTIEEQDAISYLVFGRSINELTQGQESAMNLNASGAATNMAMNQMSAMLKDVIQSSLKMDVVEISGDNNWSMGSVKVGKYIGKNLYISYQYNFALDKKTKVIEPMVISIEYQFLKFLSLSATNQSANTGFDLIFKKEF